MSASGPREVVANLVIVGLVFPRPTGDFEIRAGRAAQVDVRDAAQVVRSGEKSGVRGMAAAGKRQARETRGSKRSYVDAVSVVVKRDLIHQPRVNDVRGMNHAAVGRVAKDVSDGRHIVTAPLTIGKALGDL